MNEKLAASGDALNRIVDDAGLELRRVCDDIDLGGRDNLDLVDVILGLLARQYQLWVVAILSPAASTAPIAPLILRALADATITMAWLSANSAAAERYKIYSAGRLKLLAEHWRARETPETKEFISDYAEQLADIANTERWTAVLPVELGSWNDKDIRTMATETGLKDIYDLVYSPMSSEAHAEWMPLRQHFMRPCGETLHSTHWLPIFERPYRITNFGPAATTSFVNGIGIGLETLGADFRGDFWNELETNVKAILNEVAEATKDEPLE